MEFHVPQDRIRIFIPGFDSSPSAQSLQSGISCLSGGTKTAVPSLYVIVGGIPSCV